MKSRIILNAEYINKHAATYTELRAWLFGLSGSQLECPVMMGVPGGKIYAIRKPIIADGAGFVGEAIEVETIDETDQAS